jgi:hypothetical protein
MGYQSQLSPAALFLFGFGLSFTTFEVGDFQIKGEGTSDVTVSAGVLNTGDVAGQEVIHVYVNGILKAFTKVNVLPGQSAGVRIQLDKYAFSKWDVSRDMWMAQAQEYAIDIREHAHKVRRRKAYFASSRARLEWSVVDRFSKQQTLKDIDLTGNKCDSNLSYIMLTWACMQRETTCSSPPRQR